MHGIFTLRSQMRLNRLVGRSNFYCDAFYGFVLANLITQHG